MKLSVTSLIVMCLASAGAFSPQTPKVLADLQKAAVGGFAALTIASSALTAPPADAFTPTFSSTNIIAEKVVREGLYGEYEVDVAPQKYDDARSTFKGAKETKSKKGKYTAILAILIVGSFIVPMAQYWWYVKDDDSTDQFFGKQQKAPPAPPKKKGWF